MSSRVNTEEEKKLIDNFSMPIEWLNVMAHPTTKDKSELLLKLKYEMTVSDVHDLIEYQNYEDFMAYEQYQREKARGDR